jgi:predicted helicase
MEIIREAPDSRKSTFGALLRFSENLEEILYKVFLKSPNNLFDEFITECQKYYTSPAHSLHEIKKRDNKKIRGDIFEEFCILYLKHVKNYTNVWLLKEVPDHVIEKLNMVKRDMGIDIIVEHNDEYYAVQCKYKTATTFKKNILSWTQLSTFYALCLRTGPWSKYIVMTNCVYTRHQGGKTEKDVSMCLKTFQNITKDEWLRMCNKSGNILDKQECFEEKIVKKNKSLKPTKEELRNLRLNFYNKDNISIQ